jgi:hypothetical protein
MRVLNPMLAVVAALCLQAELKRVSASSDDLAGGDHCHAI